MSAEFGWTKTSDHVRFCRAACHQSCCCLSVGDGVETWPLDSTIRSNLLICTGGDDEMAAAPAAGGSVDCLPFHLNTRLDPVNVLLFNFF